MFEWVMRLEYQDAEDRTHAEEVRFVHTCLHVFVGTMVMCMTETVL